MKKTSLVLFVVAIFTCSSFIKAQSACCGLDILTGMLFESGVSGGYGFQQYQATGLNSLVKNLNNQSTVTNKMSEFGFAHGWKIGANLFQIQNDNSLIGLNVFYQQTKEVNEDSETASNNLSGKREYDLTLISYGIGMAYSYVINKHFDFKIIDLKFSWNQAKFIDRYSEGTNASTEEKLESPEASIGGMASTGLLYYPLPPYISLEIVGGYSYFTIDEMQFENGGPYLAKAENNNVKMENFIDGGGFFAFAQLNIAIPIFQ